MRTAIFAVLATFLAVAAAHAQQTQSDRSAKAQASTPIAGIDDAALVGSARASKLIGSKVYQGDSPIGQIEDVLVDLDHSTLTAVISRSAAFSAWATSSSRCRPAGSRSAARRSSPPI